MTYSINVLNPQAVKIGELKGVTKAEIYEVINNQYVADVLLSTNTYPSFLHFPNMLEIDNDYFIIADIDKQRDRSKSISLSLEHVSYLLNNPVYAPFVPEDEDEYYEGSIAQIINQLWGGLGQFNIVVEGIGGYYNYVPSTTGGRSRIQEFARQYGFEVIYDKFNITIRSRRGSNKGLVLEVGKNIRSISQKITLNDNFYIEYAHEVDIIDFSKMSGEQYVNIASAELGDTVRMIDNDLAIDATERIVAKRYDPLFKQIPQLDVGQVVRDIINVLNKDDERKEEEDDGALLTSFKVGDVNALPIMSDERSAVIEYITDTTLQGIIPSADVEVVANKKGVTATLKSGVNRHLTAMITTETEDGIMASFKPMPSTDFSDLVLPGSNVSVSVVMIITSVPFADLASGLIPVEGEGEDFKSPLIGAYGVRVLINDNADGFLDNFKIGDVDVLGIDKSNTTDAVIDYIKGNSPQPITKTVFEVTGSKLKGIYASLKANYKNYHLTFLYSTKDEKGNWTVETRKMPFTNARIFTTPRIKDDSVIMVITKEPFESLTATNVGNSFIKAFGIRLQMAKEIFLDEFKIGDVDLLFTEGLEIENDNLASIKAEVDYTKTDEFTGLFLKLKQSYSGYTVIVREYTASGSTSNPYSDSYKTKKYPNNTLALSVTVSKDGEQQIFGFKFKKGDGQEESWLSGFRIGNIDCLALYGVQMESAYATDIMAEIEFSKEDEFTGLLLSLKEEFKDAKITVKNQSGTVINNNSSTVLPNGNSALIVTLTKGTEMQYYGVKFTEVAFEGLITIKSKDEDGKIISTIEKTYTETGTYEIFADEIDGYELVSVSPLNVKLTVEEPEKVVEFLYKATELPELPTTGLVMETASAQYVSDLTFNFTKSYSQVVSVVTTSSTGAVVSHSLIQGTDGGYKGVKITAGGGVVSIQVVVTG